MQLREFVLEKHNRNTFIESINSRMIQIVQNFALILYCNKYDKSNPNLGHWKKELRSHIKPIVIQDIKGGDKYKAIDDAIFASNITNTDVVYKMLNMKFKVEGFNKFTKDISNEVVNNITLLRFIMVSKSFSDLYNTIGEL